MHILSSFVDRFLLPFYNPFVRISASKNTTAIFVASIYIRTTRRIIIMDLKRRANGKGTAVYLGNGRANPWAARITLGIDNNGLSIRHIIGTFDNKLASA